MKTKFLNIILIMMISLSSFTQSFNFELMPVDSNQKSGKWIIRTISISKEGGYTVNASPQMDSLKAIETFISIMDDKKISVENELKIMAKSLLKNTGKTYDESKSSLIASRIAGNYTLINGEDSLSVVINKNLQILSGKNKGTVKVSDGKMHITGSGIVTGTESLDIKSEALFENKKIKLIKE